MDAGRAVSFAIWARLKLLAGGLLAQGAVIAWAYWLAVALAG